MEEQANVKIITIKDLWEIFLYHMWIILLVAILVVSASVIGISYTYEPRYNSAATLYILQKNQSNTDIEYDDFNLALKVVNDCTHLIKSHSVLDTVKKNLDLDISYDELYRSVKIVNPADTRILEVTVESDTPQESKTIVDEICEVGTKKITETMGFEQVYFFEKGILNHTPCNKTPASTYIMIGLLAIILTYAVFLIMYLLDDKIHTDDDIKNYLHLSILGDIPNYDDTRKKKYGGKYYKYRYNYRNKYYSHSKGAK